MSSTPRPDLQCLAFKGHHRIAAGPLSQVALAARTASQGADDRAVVIFEAETSEIVEVDLRGSPEEILGRLNPEGTASGAGAAGELAEKRGPGRPKLGVIGREITLLPRHWAWLEEQPGGASVALRKLVEEAKRSNASKDRVRRARESAYRFMHTMAGDLPGFEEACRALFRGETEQLVREVASWPEDIREHIQKLVGALAETAGAAEATRAGVPTERAYPTKAEPFTGSNGAAR